MIYIVHGKVLNNRSERASCYSQIKPQAYFYFYFLTYTSASIIMIPTIYFEFSMQIRLNAPWTQKSFLLENDFACMSV